MLKSPFLWLKAAMFSQLATAMIHSLSLIGIASPQNETEKQLYDLIENYQLNMGAGFFRTWNQIFNSISISFSLFFFFVGFLNLLVLQTDIDKIFVQKLVRLQLFVFGILSFVMFKLAFLPPIICCLAIFVFLLFTYLNLKNFKN